MKPGDPPGLSDHAATKGGAHCTDENTEAQEEEAGGSSPRWYMSGPG